MTTFDRFTNRGIWFCITAAALMTTIQHEWLALTWITLTAGHRAQWHIAERDNRTLRALLRYGLNSKDNA